MGDKYQVPENFDYERVRKLFKNPEVADPKSLEVLRVQIFLKISLNGLLLTRKVFLNSWSRKKDLLKTE